LAANALKWVVWGSETFSCGSEAVQNFLFIAQELHITEHPPIVTVVTVANANP
jgi:hypothetical protein